MIWRIPHSTYHRPIRNIFVSNRDVPIHASIWYLLYIGVNNVNLCPVMEKPTKGDLKCWIKGVGHKSSKGFSVSYLPNVEPTAKVSWGHLILLEIKCVRRKPKKINDFKSFIELYSLVLWSSNFRSFTGSQVQVGVSSMGTCDNSPETSLILDKCTCVVFALVLQLQGY